jgi:hypothetical protein
MSVSRRLALHQITNKLLDAGFGVKQVGRALLALEGDESMEWGAWPTSGRRQLDHVPPDEPDDDGDRRELGPEPAPDPEPAFEPTEADLADYRQWSLEVERRWWLERLEAEELEAAARDADWQDRVEGLARVTDVDIATVTGCVG